MPLVSDTTHTDTSAHGHTNPSNRNQAVRAEMLFHKLCEDKPTKRTFPSQIARATVPTPIQMILNLDCFQSLCSRHSRLLHDVHFPLFSTAIQFRKMLARFLRVLASGSCSSPAVRSHSSAFFFNSSRVGPAGTISRPELCQCSARGGNLHGYREVHHYITSA
jgi:hypothetical protein